MSAPLVVNTADGTCWTLRATTRDGVALYAPEGVCDCPQFVMATLPELAEHGIVGSADVLPMPVGPESQGAEVALSEEQLEVLVAAGDRAVNNTVHEDLCACDAWPEKCLSSGNFFMGYWDQGGMSVAVPAVVAAWESLRGKANADVAELRTALQDTLAALLAGQVERDKLTARVAELEADRLTRLLAPTQALREDEPETGGAR